MIAYVSVLIAGHEGYGAGRDEAGAGELCRAHQSSQLWALAVSVKPIPLRPGARLWTCGVFEPSF